MARTGKKTPRAGSTEQDRIVKAVFAAGEATGITDREMLEKFTEQVLQRLNQTHLLPGMAGFVAPRLRRPISASELQAAISEVLTAAEFTPQAREKVVSGI